MAVARRRRISVAENTTAVTTVTATDTDVPAQTLTYTIIGGADQGLFTIDGDSGVLAFTSSRNFELPADSNGDNVYQVIVQVSDGNGGTNTQTINVTVSNVNETPTVTTISNQTINEDGSTGALAFTVGDPETAAGSLSVTASSSNPTLIPNGNLVLGGSGANRTITVIPAADQNGGPATITVTVSDGVNSTQTTFTVTVAAVNDAPVRTAGSVNNLTVLEDSGLWSLGLGGVAYSPGGGADEAGQTLTYTVTAVPSSAFFGDIVLADGLTVVTASTNYTLAQIQGMQLRTTLNQSGVSMFQFNVTDSGGTANGGVNTISEAIVLTITAVNDAPVVTTTGTTLNYTENAAATPVDPGLTVGDVDNANLTGATVSISTNYANGQDVLAFTNQLGITGSWSAATGVLTLTGTTTCANYETALRSISYFNSSDNPSTFTRTIAFVVNDGTANNAAATRNISVTAVNDAPVLDNTGAMWLTTITEDQTTNGGDAVFNIIASAGGDRITDPDGSPFEGIAVTELTSGNGTWQYSTTGGASWNNIGGVSDAAALLLRETDRLRFVPDGLNGTSASVTFRAGTRAAARRAQVDASLNGTIHPFSNATETATITVTAVNDAPVVMTSGGSPTYVENAPPLTVDGALTLNDVDSPTLTGATVAHLRQVSQQPRRAVVHESARHHRVVEHCDRHTHADGRGDRGRL